MFYCTVWQSQEGHTYFFLTITFIIAKLQIRRTEQIFSGCKKKNTLYDFLHIDTLKVLFFVRQSKNI